MLLSGPIWRVVAYLWLKDGKIVAQVMAELWWDGETVDNPDSKKGKFIVVKEAYREYSEPDEVRLECGHEIPVKHRHGRKWYNLRRRCPLCAAEATLGAGAAALAEELDSRGGVG